MQSMRSLMMAAILGCGAAALAGCGSTGTTSGATASSSGDQHTALFAGGDGWFGESPAKPGLYDDHGWPAQPRPAAAKIGPDAGQ